MYGEEVDPNISISLTKTWLVTIANILMAIHLVLAFLIVINPVCQELEEIFNVPHCEFNYNSVQILFIPISYYFS